jgi:hypothetical protein
MPSRLPRLVTPRLAIALALLAVMAAVGTAATTGGDPANRPATHLDGVASDDSLVAAADTDYDGRID